ncbi:hypothetical protein MOJ79_06090 [Calidifontimicrobium sp. SYSU G02091]|uniref:glycosyltransferase n=1 Tax=Calidifontimicrobium sp. SYSU G02091 TaxID=2926421 RepID=UPI001F52F8F1|nr:hypothetical protein [Calidifontimicrobium sp. SYSU G02091]
MARVLFAWELGSGLGHLQRITAVARALQERGHPVSIAARDLSAVSRVSRRGDRFLWIQAPIWLAPLRERFVPRGHCDLLAHHGFLDAAGLIGLVGGWRSIFAATQPDLLVADHAPVSLLACRGGDLRVATLGTGHAHPPAMSPMPWFEEVSASDRQAAAAREAQVLATANRVLQAVGQPAMAQMHELYATDACWLACWPSLDHYPERPAYAGRPAPVYVGPIVEEEGGEVVAWPPGDGPRVFAYLRTDHPTATTVLHALAGLRCRAVVVLSGGSPDAQPVTTARHVAVRTVPLATGPMLDTCDVVVGHGGMGLTSSALQAGRPLLLCPTQGEQRATARRLAAQGAAIAVEPNADAATVVAALETLCGEAARSSARAFAASVGALPAAGSVARAVDAIERLLAA